MKYDLHCHSHYSDGDLSPQDLLTLAAENEVTHLALTDHDSVAGIDELYAAAQNSSVEPIVGVELSSEWNGQLIHIVGLNVDPHNAELLAGIMQNVERRVERAEKMHADLQQHGIDIRLQVAKQLEQGAVPTRPHFANALIEMGLAKDKRQAFKRYLIRGKPGYIPMQWPTLTEVGAWITSAGGLAVLAHPMRYKFTRTKLIRLIVDMKEAGITGIEVSTPSNDSQQMSMLASLARSHELFASQGSDFHAPGQPWAKLGSAHPLPSELTPVWTQF